MPPQPFAPNPFPTGLAVVGVTAVGLATGAVIARALTHARERAMGPTPAPHARRPTPSPSPTQPPRQDQAEQVTVAPSRGIPWLYRAAPESGGFVAEVQSPRGAIERLPERYSLEPEALSAAEDWILSQGGMPVAQWVDAPTPIPVLAPGTHHLYFERFYHLALPRGAATAVWAHRGAGPRLVDLIFMRDVGTPGHWGVKVHGTPSEGSQTIDVDFYEDEAKQRHVARYSFVVQKKPWWLASAG